MSMTTPPGLAIDSQKIALVLGVTARWTRRVGASAHATRQSNFLKEWLNWLTEPP